jgi:uncharacterized glyoxalase superfamily metalloenzyme YdcJ
MSDKQEPLQPPRRFLMPVTFWQTSFNRLQDGKGYQRKNSSMTGGLSLAYFAF